MNAFPVFTFENKNDIGVFLFILMLIDPIYHTTMIYEII